MAIAQQYLPGTIVVYAGDGATRRTLAAVVSGPHEGGTYDLECKQRVPSGSIRAVAGGERVEYFSASLNNWIPSQVLRMGRTPGTFDLDCKEGVDLRRMRLPRDEAGTTPRSATKQPQQGPPSLRQGESPGSLGGQAGLQPGDHCYYKSSAHGWIPAQVARYHPEDGSYDLDVKQRVRLEALFCLREGEPVEYHSASTGQWIPARVLRKSVDPGRFDLDVKERVDLHRMRPPMGAAPTPSAASNAPAPSAPHPPSAAVGAPVKDRAHPWASPPSPRMAQSRPTLDPYPASGAGDQHGAFVAKPMAGNEPCLPTLDPKAPHACSAASQEAARAELQRARWGGEPGPLREALRLAAEAGLPREEVEPAERAQRQMQALADLQQAAFGKSAENIRSALRSAADAGVPREELGHGERALAMLEAQEARTQQARATLQRACQCDDAPALQEALSSATSAGIAQDELAAGQRALAILQARDELRLAIRARDVGRLHEALQVAASRGVLAEELESAKRILATLQAEASQLHAARANLQHAAHARDPQALQEALSAAARVGLPFEELDQARQALDALKAQLAARQQVHQAIATGGLAELREALRSAAQAGVPQGELDVAVSRLQALEADGQRSSALERLRRAAAAGDAAALRAALEAAAGLGLSGDELDQAAHTLWALEARPAALAELRRCAARQSVPSLLAAIEAAAVAGVPESELEAAHRALRALETAQAQARVQEALREACRSEDVGALRRAIDAAAREGLRGPELEDAARVLRDVEARGRAREELQRAEVAAARSRDAGSMAALRSALRSAELAGLSANELESPRSLLQSWEQPMTDPQLQAPAYAQGSGGSPYWGAGDYFQGTVAQPADPGAYPLLTVPQTNEEFLPAPTDPHVAIPGSFRLAGLGSGAGLHTGAVGTKPSLVAPIAGLQAGVPGTDPQVHAPPPVSWGGASREEPVGAGASWTEAAGAGLDAHLHAAAISTKPSLVAPAAGLQAGVPGTDPQVHAPPPASWSGGGLVGWSGIASLPTQTAPPAQIGVPQTRSPYDAYCQGLGTQPQVPPTDPQLPMTDPQLIPGM